MWYSIPRAGKVSNPIVGLIPENSQVSHNIFHLITHRKLTLHWFDEDIAKGNVVKVIAVTFMAFYCVCLNGSVKIYWHNSRPRTALNLFSWNVIRILRKIKFFEHIVLHHKIHEVQIKYYKLPKNLSVSVEPHPQYYKIDLKIEETDNVPQYDFFLFFGKITKYKNITPIIRSLRSRSNNIIIIAGLIDECIALQFEDIENLKIYNRVHTDQELMTLCKNAKAVIVSCRNFTTTGQMAFLAGRSNMVYLSPKVLVCHEYKQPLVTRNLEDLLN